MKQRDNAAPTSRRKNKCKKSGNCERNRPFGRPRPGLEGNVEMYSKRQDDRV
jgi:hypothetical protein